MPHFSPGLGEVGGTSSRGSRLKRFSGRAFVLLLLFANGFALAQISSPDERYKADILLVVAHPDDDTVVSSYLARAVFDQHKRVAIVFCTPGDSGSNSEGREHARALGLVREIEARRAMIALGITNVWFLNGRDTASQDVQLSLATWPSASVLEQAVRVIRLTRPEVVMSWLPSSVAGENHGDHQASGVIATEAFDIAGDPTVFPSQVAAPLRQYENALEGLSPWQSKKLYYFTDAFDTEFFRGHGPEYDGKDISSSKHVSYLQLAARSAAAYYTQLLDPNLGKRIEAGDTSSAFGADLVSSCAPANFAHAWKCSGGTRRFLGLLSRVLAGTRIEFAHVTASRDRNTTRRHVDHSTARKEQQLAAAAGHG